MDVSIKTSLSFFCFLFSIAMAQASDIVYGPHLCSPNELTVVVKNKTSHPQRMWTQTRTENNEIRELHHDLEPLSELKIPGEQFLSEPSGYSLKTLETNTLQFSAHCRGHEKVILSGTASPDVDHYLPPQTNTVLISILNLYIRPQDGFVQFFTQNGVLLGQEKFSLEKYYETLKLKISVPAGTQRVHIQGGERLHSILTAITPSREQMIPGVVLNPTPLKPLTEKSYFLVSTKDWRPEESFVIALDDSEKITTAREQIRNPNLEKIIVAGITLGNGGFNRSFQRRDRAPYSWSVNRVDAFADFAHIDCDGSPEITEERLEEKLSQGGRICFWRYRVVRELTHDEVRSGRLTKP